MALNSLRYGVQPGEPLSPWAQRFGPLRGVQPVKEGDLRHSGLATQNPRLDPKFYGDLPLESDTAASRSFKSQTDLDRHFLIEELQNRHGGGAEQWQFGPMSQYVRFSGKSGLIGGGHRSNDVSFLVDFRSPILMCLGTRTNYLILSPGGSSSSHLTLHFPSLLHLTFGDDNLLSNST
jgi:hypothetical protein